MNKSTNEHRSDFDTFKSGICHSVKNMGDLNFIINILESDEIQEYWNKEWYFESLYLLAMLDYLSRENDLPLCNKYNDLRCAKMAEPIYPSGILLLDMLSNSDKHKKESYENAIPEFKQFNIVENEIRNIG